MTGAVTLSLSDEFCEVNRDVKARLAVWYVCADVIVWLALLVLISPSQPSPTHFHIADNLC